MYRQKKVSFVICLIVITHLLLNALVVYGAGDTIVLNSPDTSTSKVFVANNMFPGDKESREYVLNISHRNSITVMFNARVQKGFETLAEVLNLKVEIKGVTKPLYDGLMKDMPASVSYTLTASQKSVTYVLSVYLDTSVGNDYQNQELKADFSWWYMSEDTGGVIPGGTVVGPTKMLRRAYMVGRPNNLFEPEAPITRAETATIFARIFANYNEANLISTDTKFKDVPQGEWYTKYISRSEKENIIFGYDGYFRPNENITRAEFASICVRFFEKRSGSIIKPADISFSDFDKSHWAYEAIRKAYANGYVFGYTDGTIRADATITRAEAVAIVNRMLERVPDKEYIDKNLHKLIDFTDVRDNTYWAYYEIFEAANTHYVRFVNNFAKWVD